MAKLLKWASVESRVRAYGLIRKKNGTYEKGRVKSIHGNITSQHRRGLDSA